MKPVTKKEVSKDVKKEAVKETKKVDTAAEIEKLLKTLSNEEDKMEKRRLRRNLRSLGHRGGLKNTKFDKTQPKAKVKVKETAKA